MCLYRGLCVFEPHLLLPGVLTVIWDTMTSSVLADVVCVIFLELEVNNSAGQQPGSSHGERDLPLPCT